ncbi:hypothetical protein L1887_36703 [Cichorium endivia]|nr:hypothetical protein L1887_36703 [Cichorium endivia]
MEQGYYDTFPQQIIIGLSLFVADVWLLCWWFQSPGATAAAIQNHPPSAVGDPTNLDAMVLLASNKGRPMEAIVEQVGDSSLSASRISVFPSVCCWNPGNKIFLEKFNGKSHEIATILDAQLLAQAGQFAKKQKFKARSLILFIRIWENYVEGEEVTNGHIDDRKQIEEYKK